MIRVIVRWTLPGGRTAQKKFFRELLKPSLKKREGEIFGSNVQQLFDGFQIRYTKASSV